MSEAPKMYTCSWCGKPTPNYREYSHPMAGILGESGYSVCDECLRKARIEREWENEQCAEERLICPYCESSIDDPWYYDEDDEEVECPECKRTFELEITTVRTYRTKRRIEDMPDVMSVTCPACGMSNSIAWGSMDLPPFRQAVAMLADSWNSR